MFLKFLKNKCNAILDSSLDFAGVSRYLTTKISAWKRGCTIAFKLRMPRTSPTPFGKFLYRSTKKSKNWNPLTPNIIFTGC